MALLPPPSAKHKAVVGVCAVVLALLVVEAISGKHGLLHLLRLRAELRETTHVAFELQQANQELRQRIRRLQSDDAYIEKLARERLGLARAGEIVYRLAAPTPQHPPLP